MEKYDLENIEIGKQIFEDVPKNLTPYWAGLILSQFDYHFDKIPQEIKNLYLITEDSDRWIEALEQFTKIRKFLLNNPTYKPESYVLLAELIAKVTYNSASDIAPFDAHSGWYIPQFALTTAQYLNVDHIVEDVTSVLLLFKNNKAFKENFQAAKEFVIFKKIDNILWFDWDPIGVNDIAARDEYQSYVLPVCHLKQSGASKHIIARLLLQLETDRMGLAGSIDRCLLIADKILRAN